MKFPSEHENTVHKIAKYISEFVVHPRLEILPGKFSILLLGHNGREYIAHLIAPSIKILDVFTGPHRPIARSRNLVPFEVHEFVGRNIVWQQIFPLLFQQNGEDDAVEDDVVLANEMHQLGVFVLPIWLPIHPLLGGPIAGGCDVSEGRIKPHIQDLSVGTFHGHWNSPIEVPRHGTALKPSINPTAALAQYVGLPSFGVVMDLAI